MLDHAYLNDIEGLENPTIEKMAEWLWMKLESQCPRAVLSCDPRNTDRALHLLRPVKDGECCGAEGAPLQSMFWCGNRAGLDCFLAQGDYSVGGFFGHLLQQQSQMSVWPVIGGRDVLDAIGVG